MTTQAIERTNGNGAVQKAAPQTLKAFLEGPGVKGKLAEVATRVLKPEDLVRLALMAASRQPELLKCSHTSILRALMDACALGIAPGGTMGRGYLVPRKNRSNGELEASFDPGWRGLCDIARRDPRVKKIDAKVVYDGEDFEYEEGTDQKLVHIPRLDLTGEEAVIAAYAMAKVDEDWQIVVLRRSEIEKIRNTSASKGGPWASWYEEMAKKSAVRRLCKYLPYNPMLERAMEHATDAESGERTAPDPVATDKQPRAKSLAASLRQKAEHEAESEAPPEEPAVTADGEVVEQPEATNG